MKRQWSPEELIKHFSLLPQEQTLLPSAIANAVPHNQLGFAVLLKFFQLEARFLQHTGEIPKSVVAFIAQQLQFEADVFFDYKWQGRTIKKHKDQIREYLGFRPKVLRASNPPQAIAQSFLNNFCNMPSHKAGWPIPDQIINLQIVTIDDLPKFTE